VDGAETDRARALAVNAEGPAHLARACEDVGARLVHVSTDYVFDGRQSRPYGEEDPPRPLGVYGATKLAGERAVLEARGPHLVVRTSGVFGAGGSRVKGGSFPERILGRARQGLPLRVVSDQVFSPTYAPDLAVALLALVERQASGLVHVTNSGCCSWHELAVAALRLAGSDTPVEEIHAAELARPAPRPAYSVLANERFHALGLAPLRSWRDALAGFLDR
jgi:dTDP-4-dehydrorhamnose reductase